MKESDIATLVQAVSGGNLSHHQIRDRAARAMWTGVAEPGDRLAGVLCAGLGAADALEMVVGRRTASDIFAALRAVDLGAVGGQELSEREVAKALERWRPRLEPSSTLQALRQAERHGARLLVPDAAGWPTGVNDLGSHSPLALWCRGTDAALLALANSIALVGARAATGYGEHVTMEAAAGLVDRGYAVVSGAAYGIDGMAHRSALASKGITVAFLAGGVDRFYPSGHDALLGRIVDSGAVISELPCGQAPTKWRFLQRNRLIAAASRATIVLEAGWRSGSLNTAGHAATLGRPLGAVPGPVTSAASAGCHRLIREFDAVCVTNADEMAELAPMSAALDLSALGLPSAGSRPDPSPPGGSTSQTRVLDALSTRSSRTVEDIAVRSGLSLHSVRAVLGVLELEGRALDRPDGWVVRTATVS